MNTSVDQYNRWRRHILRYGFPHLNIFGAPVRQFNYTEEDTYHYGWRFLASENVSSSLHKPLTDSAYAMLHKIASHTELSEFVRTNSRYKFIECINDDIIIGDVKCRLAPNTEHYPFTLAYFRMQVDVESTTICMDVCCDACVILCVHRINEINPFDTLLMPTRQSGTFDVSKKCTICRNPTTLIKSDTAQTCVICLEEKNITYTSTCCKASVICSDCIQ